MGVVLKADDVAIRYITGDFKDIGIKEYTMRRLTGNYHVKEFMAVDGVSFELEEGDMLGIIGSNGAGKSTLLKAIAGIMEPTRGQIQKNGDVAALLELGSGFDGDLTVKENAYLRGAMLGYTRDFMDKTYDQIIEFAELREFEDRPFKQLSSGMKSRLAFSIASLVNPDILILDEVLSVGDGAFKEKSAMKMKEIISRGAATILVSHSLDEIRELCNKVLWIDHGKQIAFGETEEVCSLYECSLKGEPLPKVCMMVTEYEGSEKNFTEVEGLNSVTKNERKRNTFWIVIAVLGIMLVSLLGISISGNVLQPSILILSAAEREITFRGGRVDGVWYNPNDILISDGNWIEDAEENTYTSTGGESFTIDLPLGRDRILVFDSGPEEGLVRLEWDGGAVYWEMRQGDFAEWGKDCVVPDPRAQAFGGYVVFVIFFGMLFVIVGDRKLGNAPAKKTLVRRNGFIELLRFIVCMYVCIHHYAYDWSPSGYLGVDFFFVLSGFLLMRHFNANENDGVSPGKAALQYTRGRYRRLLPHYMFTFLLSVILTQMIAHSVTLPSLISNNLWELLLLEGAGFSDNLMIEPGWYCSSLILAGYLVYFLLKKCKENYLYFIAPVSLLLIWGWMYQKIGHLNRWTQYDTFVFTGTLRGFAEIGLGCICCQICEKLREKEGKNFSVISTVAESLCFAYMMYIVVAAGPSRADFVCAFAMAVLITSAFLQWSLFSKLFVESRLANYLGEISMAIYLNHLVLSKIDFSILLNISWKVSVYICLAVVILFSVVSSAFVGLVKRLLEKHFLKV